MARATNYLETQLINHIFRNIAFASPTTLYAAAHVGDPGDTGANEVGAVGSYARVAISTVGGTEFAAPTDGVTSNVNEHEFPEATADWGEVTHLSLWDAASGGNCLLTAPTDLSQLISSTSTLRIAAGKLIGQVR